MSTTSKTRQAAKRGERSKPHYFLANPTSRMFCYPFSARHARMSRRDLCAIEAFEARIDWSTWGPSRVAR